MIFSRFFIFELKCFVYEKNKTISTNYDDHIIKTDGSRQSCCRRTLVTRDRLVMDSTMRRCGSLLYIKNRALIRMIIKIDRQQQ